MTYEQALEYIHGISNFFCKPGLERIKELCQGLGNPQDKLKFIHIAGTNGKGSVSCMISSILREAGYKVGLYTSPYILQFNERMRINGENIPNDRLAHLTEKVRKIAEKMTDRPTEFELITAIAFQYFFEESCDVVVLEVGMGGRLDATNVIKSPPLSIITGIALDHTAFLGDTIEQIAEEKAGIIKHNSKIIFGGEDVVSEKVIARISSNMQSKLYKIDYSELKINSFDLGGTSFNFGDYPNVRIGMLGSYQPKNACIVLAACDILNESGISIDEMSIRGGLLKAKWPARFEIIHKDPLVIFDGAHNPQGIGVAVESIKSYFPDKKVVVLSGVLRDKDYTTIAKSISEIALYVYTITPENPRALTAEKYARIILDNGVNSLPCQSISEAILLAKQKALEENTALICLGSLYTYGEVLSAIKDLD